MSINSDIAALAARHQADLIRAGEISAVEVLDAALARIEKLNPKLNAIVTLLEGQARAAALQADQAVRAGEPLGLLHGLPLVVKDVTDVAAVPTTYGSPLFRDNVAEQDAEVIARLRRAGAIFLGKTNTPEFATGANTVNDLFGATLNPWNPELSPAGSSGGSAVAVATGMAPLAQGTDFGCSIRIPASFCGIVGLRTTPGLIPNDPMNLYWDPGQVHGPMARSAEDAALMLDAMTGFDPYWPISIAPSWTSALDVVSRTEDARGLKIAYAPDIAGIGVDAEVDQICRQAARRLSRHGAEVDEIDFDVSEGREAYMTWRGEWMIGQRLQQLDLIDRFGPNLAGNLKAGLQIDALDRADGQHVRQAVWRKYRALLTRYDYLVTPAAPVPPYPVSQNFPDRIGGKQLENYVDWIAGAYLVTLVGFPAGSVPAGLTASRLPVGLQIIGRRLADANILGLAKLVAADSAIGSPPAN
ncbi:amidase [Phreatobacter stygius]|nr:amidase [Phreatobacter stygius]